MKRPQPKDWSQYLPSDLAARQTSGGLAPQMTAIVKVFGVRRETGKE
jgi:hypothetical protein